jgi:ribosomal protein S18 acetylase RimI-like enzyme
MVDLVARRLFERSVATLVQSWRYLASGSPGAEAIEADGAAIAAFVHEPDREFLNNSLLPGDGPGFEAALRSVERVYAERGIERFAVWVHESDAAAAGMLAARGYAYDSSTRSMAMDLADFTSPGVPPLDLAEPDLEAFWRVAEVPGMTPGLPSAGAHFYLARFEGRPAATLMAFDHEGDCGIYMVGTAPAARRRGIATSLSALAVAEARKRGCETASLQATPMAESVYAAIGFRDLGRFDEYVPR